MTVPFPFVVGSPRSGTTLVRAMLDSHPDMAVPPECYFVSRLAVVRTRYDRAEGFDGPRLAADLAEDRWFVRWNMDRDTVAELLAGVGSYADAIRTVYERYASDRGKVRYGDKTPENLFSMELIHRLFPESRFVHLIRDGRDVVLSMREAGFVKGDEVDLARYWRRRVERGRRSGRRLDDAYLEVRYERLISDPERELRRLCRFVGLDFVPEMLRYYEHADALLADLNGAQSHRALRLPPGKTRDWRTELDAQTLARVEAAVGRTLDDLGYERSSPVSLPTRLGGMLGNAAAHLREIERRGSDRVRRGVQT